MEWRNIYRGMVMGTSDVIPGVSGGTIAVLLGIYDELIAAINGFFSREWKKHLRFLFPLMIGMILAIFTVARMVRWLLAHYSGPTHFFFLGLILGALPFLFQEAEVSKVFRLRQYLYLFLGILLMILFDYFMSVDQEVLIVERSFLIYLLFFFSGFIGSAAMVLPGISGSFILLVIGVYPSVLHALTHFQMDVILMTGSGIAIGIIVMSKIIHFFLKNYQSNTFALIIGLIIGSVVIVFPGWPTTIGLGIAGIIAFALGLFTAHILGQVESET